MAVSLKEVANELDNGEPSDVRHPHLLGPEAIGIGQQKTGMHKLSVRERLALVKRLMKQLTTLNTIEDGLRL